MPYESGWHCHPYLIITIGTIIFFLGGAGIVFAVFKGYNNDGLFDRVTWALPILAIVGGIMLIA
jgi:hypothetical protein